MLWLRAQPDSRALVEACYYDDPLVTAARRFEATEEWAATRALLGGGLSGDVLDLGAGRGIVSYAFARQGCRVSALEPDPSPVVGRGAIEELSRAAGMDIRPVAGFGEALPFPDATFDVVYGRAVLHHARDLPALCREVARVLRPGGRFLAVREHVISRSADLPAFLQAHPLHALYGGEHAFLLRDYRTAITGAGLRLLRTLGPWDDPVNYWPTTWAELRQALGNSLARRLTRPVAALLTSRPLFPWLTWCLSRTSNAPGRHFAFLGSKP